jgi:hypothetical protein
MPVARRWTPEEGKYAIGVNVLNVNLAANCAIKRPKQQPATGEDASYRVLMGKLLADHMRRAAQRTIWSPQREKDMPVTGAATSRIASPTVAANGYCSIVRGFGRTMWMTSRSQSKSSNCSP